MGIIFNELTDKPNVWFSKEATGQQKGTYFTLIWKGNKQHNFNTHVHVYDGERGEGYSIKFRGYVRESGWASEWEGTEGKWSAFFVSAMNNYWWYAGGPRRGRSQTSKRKRVKRRSSKRKRVKKINIYEE